MTSSKLKVTAEMKKALDSVVERMKSTNVPDHYTDINSVLKHKVDENCWVRERYPITDLPVEQLAQALYVGYEVELTVGEKLHELYIKGQGEKVVPIMPELSTEAYNFGYVRAFNDIMELYPDLLNLK